MIASRFSGLIYDLDAFAVTARAAGATVAG
jgi:hypothetical protein